MKIAVISEGRTPVFGGGQVHVKFLCEGLVKQYGAQVDLFVRKLKGDDGKIYNQDESLMEGKWRIIRTGRTAVFFNGFARVYWVVAFTIYLIWKAKKEKYDIIHAHALLPGFPAKIAGWISKIPVVFTVHGTMHLDVPRKDKYYYLEKLIVTQIPYDLEISVSREIYRYPNKNQNIQIICNGVDIQAYDLVRPESKYEGLNFITVARIDWQKNHQIALEVINELDRKLLDKVGFCWNIVGDGPLREKTENYIHKHNLGSYVKLKGKLFGNQLIQEYQKNHVFLLPSLGEGQPLTILEAFASKLPVVATQVGDNKYFVKEGETGLLIAPGDKEALKNVVLKIIGMSHTDIAAMGERGYEFVQEYDWSKVVDRTMEGYKKLVG